MRTALLLAAVAVLSGAWVHARPDDASAAGADSGENAAAAGAPITPQQIVDAIHSINLLEIQVGQLAQDKAPDADVRRYGLLLERDHRFGDTRLLKLAAAQSIPVQALAPQPADQRTLRRLNEDTGAAFDQDFLKAMKTGHDQAIATLETAQRQTQDAALARLIRKILPILRQHDQLAADLQS